MISSETIPIYLTNSKEWITESNCFEYEVSYYMIYPKQVELLGCRTYKRLKPLKYKKKTIYKYIGTPKRKVTPSKYCIMKTIDWLSAPIEYIEKMRFKKVLDKPKKPRKKKKK